MYCAIKGFKHERIEDAPFIGCVVIAATCKQGCKGCCNQHLKNLPVQCWKIEDIISEVKSDKMNQGIIFGGLEWMELPRQLQFLMEAAAEAGLKIMLYTSYNEDTVLKQIGCSIQSCSEKVPVYVKYGKYIHNRPKTEMFGITLASDNQYIVKYGKAS